MLAIKCTPNIFFISAYVSPPSFQQDIWYVKLGVLKNYKLFRIYWGRIRHLLILNPYLYIHEVLTKHPREKIWTRENTFVKIFWPKKYPSENILDPRNTLEKKFWTHDVPTRKIFWPTKARWQIDTRLTRPMMARDPRNLAHSVLSIFYF